MLGILGHFNFIGILNKLIYVYKKPCRDFENCVNPVNQFSVYSHSYYFETLNRQTHYVSPIIKVSFGFFHPFYLYLSYKSCTFVQIYSISFLWSKFKWHTFFISFFISSFLVCRSAICFFCVPVSCKHTKLTYQLQDPKKNSLVFSTQKIMLSANKDHSILLSRPIDFNVTKYKQLVKMV